MPLSKYSWINKGIFPNIFVEKNEVGGFALFCLALKYILFLSNIILTLSSLLYFGYEKTF